MGLRLVSKFGVSLGHPQELSNVKYIWREQIQVMVLEFSIFQPQLFSCHEGLYTVSYGHDRNREYGCELLR